MNRVDWDTYFLTLAFIVANRSLDSNTIHGTVIVGQDKSILSTGYNSFPRGCKDSELPLTKPEKYHLFSHSELSAIANCAKNGIKIDGSTFYITGEPCEFCLKSIINCGVSKIIHGKIKSNCINKESQEYKKLMLKGQKIEIIEHSGNGILELLEKTANYVKERNK